jgi:hypothetical protein
MPRSLAFFALVLASGCSGNEALAPEQPCAPLPPSSHWPVEPGILQLPTSMPATPFTPAPHRAPPVIASNDATVIASPRIVPVITNGDPLADTLFAFADAVPQSAWWPAVSASWGISALRAGPHVVAPEMPAAMTVADIVSYVRGVIAPVDAAAPDGATVYLLFLAPSVLVVDAANQRNCNCAVLSGYHGPFGEGGDAVAVVQRCSVSDIDALTSAASHEILEAATDPSGSNGYREPIAHPAWTGSVWADDEVADICAGTRIHVGEWEYQRSFTNPAAQQGDDPCVPALEEPYFNVTAPEDWYPVPAGGSATVTITGWSTAPRSDWFVYPSPSRETRFNVAFVTDESDAADGVTFYGINNGKTGKLTVTATSARSGASTIVHLFSRLSSPGSDSLHVWEVGFYVP